MGIIQKDSKEQKPPKKIVNRWYEEYSKRKRQKFISIALSFTVILCLAYFFIVYLRGWSGCSAAVLIILLMFFIAILLVLFYKDREWEDGHFEREEMDKIDRML